jgi:hypothetical protein
VFILYPGGKEGSCGCGGVDKIFFKGGERGIFCLYRWSVKEQDKTRFPPSYNNSHDTISDPSPSPGPSKETTSHMFTNKTSRVGATVVLTITVTRSLRGGYVCFFFFQDLTNNTSRMCVLRLFPL